MQKRPIIAIDGPAGAGKSTASALLARHLGFAHISTGQLYRAVALAALQHQIAFADDAGLGRLIDAMAIDVRIADGHQQTLVNGNDVSEKLNTAEIGQAASAVSARIIVREKLLDIQRRVGQNGGVVLDGRDIGTVVFPDADIKFFLTASAETRAKRRQQQLVAENQDSPPLAMLTEMIRARDDADQNRTVAPLAQAPDAYLIESESLSLEQVVEKMLSLIRREGQTL